LVTWPWRAPELVCGRRAYDAHVDEWALGCIVNEIAFLVLPFGLLARSRGDSKTSDDALVTRDIGARLGYPRSFRELVRTEAERERPPPNAEIASACEAMFSLYPDLTGADDGTGFVLHRYEALWLTPEARRPLAEYYGADLYLALWHYIYDLLHVDPRARRNDGLQSAALFGAYPCRVAPRSPATIRKPHAEPDFQDAEFAGVRPLTRQFAQHIWNQLLLTGQVPRDDDPERTRWRVGAAVLAAQLMDDRHGFDVARYRVGFGFETRLMQALGDDPWHGFIVD
jgi:serine/threonine protein kinase